MRVTGRAEFSVRNQAIGALIEQGYTPDESRMELRRRATRDDLTSLDTATVVLRPAGRKDPASDGDSDYWPSRGTVARVGSAPGCQALEDERPSARDPQYQVFRPPMARPVAPRMVSTAPATIRMIPIVHRIEMPNTNPRTNRMTPKMIMVELPSYQCRRGWHRRRLRRHVPAALVVP